MAEHQTTINDFLLDNGLLIKNNPAISPDLTLDFESLMTDIRYELGILESIKEIKCNLSFGVKSISPNSKERVEVSIMWV